MHTFINISAHTKITLHKPTYVYRNNRNTFTRNTHTQNSLFYVQQYIPMQTHMNIPFLYCFHDKT